MTSAKTRDHELLLLTRRGDGQAAAELWARFGGRMKAYAVSILRDAACAEDVVQQVLLRVLSLDDRYLREVDDVLAWLMQGVRHTAMNECRARARATARLEAVSRETPRQKVQPEPAREPLEDLHAALEELADDHREVLVLRQIAGLTFDQVALALGENRSTVASRYRAALALLCELVAENNQPDRVVEHGFTRGDK